MKSFCKYKTCIIFAFELFKINEICDWKYLNIRVAKSNRVKK